MNTCKDLRADLLDFADGRATPDAARRVEAHLAGCAACRTTAERLGAPPVLRVDVPPPVLTEMRADLHDRLDALDPMPSWLRWLFSGSFTIPKPLAWAAAAALIVLYAGNRPAAPIAPPAAPPAAPAAVAPARAILLDRVDRLTLSDGTAQG